MRGHNIICFHWDIRENIFEFLQYSPYLELCWYLYTYENLKFHAQLSWAWKKFYNLRARSFTLKMLLWEMRFWPFKVGFSLIEVDFKTSWIYCGILFASLEKEAIPNKTGQSKWKAMINQELIQSKPTLKPKWERGTLTNWQTPMQDSHSKLNEQLFPKQVSFSYPSLKQQ